MSNKVKVCAVKIRSGLNTVDRQRWHMQSSTHRFIGYQRNVGCRWEQKWWSGYFQICQGVKKILIISSTEAESQYSWLCFQHEPINKNQERHIQYSQAAVAMRSIRAKSCFTDSKHWDGIKCVDLGGIIHTVSFEFAARTHTKAQTKDLEQIVPSCHNTPILSDVFGATGSLSF